MIKWLTILLISFQSHAQISFGIARSGGVQGGIVFAGKTAVFIGDSFVFGVAATDDAHRWTSLFCAGKGATEDNRGVNGLFMQQNSSCGGAASPIDETTIPAYSAGTHSALFIAIGINDVGLNKAAFTPAGFKSDYQNVLEYAISTRGWPAELIILVNVYHPVSWSVYTSISGCSISVAADDTRGEDYNEKIAELSAENETLLVDIWTAMLGLNSSYYAIDGLHCVNTGHAVIANYLLSVL